MDTRRSFLFDRSAGFPLCATDRFTCFDSVGFSLRRGYLVTNDAGRMLHNRNEEIGRFSWARKVIDLSVAGRPESELALLVHEYKANQEPLEVSVNERLHVLAPGGTGQGQWRWIPLPLSAGSARAGPNRIELRAGNLGFSGWSLAIDSGNPLGQSFKSFDEGGTWQRDRLGFDYSLQGEYIIRWYIQEEAPGGVVSSPALSIRPVAGAGPIPVEAKAEQDGPAVTFEFRSGTGCDPSASPWTDWFPGPFCVAAEHSHLQWRALLKRGNRIRSVELLLGSGDGPVQVTPVAHLSPVELPAYDIVRERPDHPYLTLLRQQERLDEIAGPGTDFERARRLCHWLAAQWSHSNRYEVYPPYQAATILNWLRADYGHGFGGVLGFCVTFGTTLAQCCSAMGLPARGVIIGNPPNHPMGGHFVTEVYCREFGKWATLDADTDVLMTHQGVPVSSLDLHRLWKAGKAAEVEYSRGPAYGNSHASGPVDGETFLRNLVTLGGYRFFGVPLRQDPFSRPDLQMVSHGATAYREPDVVWYTDVPDLYRRFPLCTLRPADLHYPGPPQER